MLPKYFILSEAFDFIKSFSSFLISGIMNAVCLVLTMSLTRFSFYNHYADLSEIANKGKFKHISWISYFKY